MDFPEDLLIPEKLENFKLRAGDVKEVFICPISSSTPIHLYR